MLIKLAQLENCKYFFQEKIFFFEFCIYPIFLVPVKECISGDENLVILYDTNPKLASIMPFWVFHCKWNLFWATFPLIFLNGIIIGSKLAVDMPSTVE